jgi:hypothetical protein
LKTPGGKPTYLEYYAIFNAVNGVLLAGLRIIVQPVAKAGPIFHESNESGKFQGII